MTTAAPIKIDQSLKGYRYSVEPFLLADFVRIEEGSRVLDVGTGCGIIPLLLTQRVPDLQITAAKGTSHREPAEDVLNMVYPDGSYTPQMQEIYAFYNYSGRSHGLREKRNRR